MGQAVVTESSPKARSSKVALYALIVGAIGGGASAAAQVTNADGWVFVVISFLAFPFVGVSVAIGSFVAVITGYVWGNLVSTIVTGLVLFIFFTAVAAAQAYAWIRLTARGGHGDATSADSRGHVDSERTESH